MLFVPMKYEKDVKLATPSTNGGDWEYGVVCGEKPGRLVMRSMMRIYGIGFFVTGCIPVA
jgi:hypothetical protein